MSSDPQENLQAIDAAVNPAAPLSPMQNQWESYRTSVVPEKATDVQVTETALAFYSGAMAAFNLVQECLAEEDTEAAVGMLDALEADIQRGIVARVKKQVEIWKQEHGGNLVLSGGQAEAMLRMIIKEGL